MIFCVGKNAIIDCLTRIFVNFSSKIECIQYIIKKFNANLSNKVLIYGDEICAKAADLRDKLKNVITRTEMELEKKNFDSI